MTYYKQGDLVRYSAAFLNSVGWHTDVPHNGIVLEDLGVVGDDQRVEVWWCDQEPSDSSNVLAFNLERCPHDPELCGGMRRALLLEALGDSDD